MKPEKPEARLVIAWWENRCNRHRASESVRSRGLALIRDRVEDQRKDIIERPGDWELRPLAVLEMLRALN